MPMSKWGDVRGHLLAASGDRRSAVDALYLPSAHFMEEVLQGARARDAEATREAPLIFGISGPQGGGKSTLADTLVSALDELGRRAMAFSIDDFYLTYDEQRALSAEHPGNPYLEHRGYPGT